jgi:hypothetical protein
MLSSPASTLRGLRLRLRLRHLLLLLLLLAACTPRTELCEAHDTAMVIIHLIECFLSLILTSKVHTDSTAAMLEFCKRKPLVLIHIDRSKAIPKPIEVQRVLKQQTELTPTDETIAAYVRSVVGHHKDLLMVELRPELDDCLVNLSKREHTVAIVVHAAEEPSPFLLVRHDQIVQAAVTAASPTTPLPCYRLLLLVPLLLLLP